MKSRSVRFPGAFGSPLAARFDLPDDPGTPRAYALFAHCFSCSKDLKAVHRLSRSLTAQGFAVLRFDFTGLGDSEGSFADTNFSSNLDDLRAAVAYLDEAERAPDVLIGHSLGGTAVLAIAGEVASARAVATIGAPSDTDHLRASLARQAPELADGGADATTIELAGRPFRIRRQLFDDLERHAVLEAVAELRRPLLVFHSPVDDVVDVDHARRIFEAAKHPKSFVSLDRADHLLLRDRADAAYAGAVLAAWAGRYLDAPADAETEPTGVPHGEVRVHGGASGYLQTIEAGRHRLVADEPEKVGGGDQGPDPYALLLAALGACTGMTLRMYADRKSWPLTGVDVTLRHRKIHAQDCADCVTEAGMVDEIERVIRVLGDELGDQQVARLMEIADRCPVHRTLEGEIKIRTRRADQPSGPERNEEHLRRA